MTGLRVNDVYINRKGQILLRLDENAVGLNDTTEESYEKIIETWIERGFILTKSKKIGVIGHDWGIGYAQG